jgi:hypothetical protein
MAENDKVPKFGHGQYESALRNESPPSVKHARSYFLDVVKTLAPIVLEDLGGEPYRLYWEAQLCFEANETSGKRDLVARHIWTSYQRPSWREIEHPFRNPLLTNSLDDEDEYMSEVSTHQFRGENAVANTPVEMSERISEFRDSLFNWSRRHRLDTTWCRERAYDTLDWWCLSQESRRIQMWDYDGAYQTIMAFRGDHPRFTFEYKTLYPREGFRPDVKRRIMEAVEKELDAFLDGREALAEENGMVAPRQKRDKQHFEWLVCFQVNQMSYADILELYFPNEFATAKKAGNISDRTKRIRKAVNEVADFINLPLREDGVRPGRRSKASQTSE